MEVEELTERYRNERAKLIEWCVRVGGAIVDGRIGYGMECYTRLTMIERRWTDTRTSTDERLRGFMKKNNEKQFKLVRTEVEVRCEPRKRGEG